MPTPIFDALVEKHSFHPTEVAARHDRRLIKDRIEQEKWLMRVLSPSFPKQRKARR